MAESIKIGRSLDSYRREKAREMAESVLLADGSNQNSASIQLVSAREDHASTAARAPNTFLHTGGDKKEERYANRSSKRGDIKRKEDRRFGIIKASNVFMMYELGAANLWYGLILRLTVI